jgi:hypothetical protein
MDTGVSNLFGFAHNLWGGLHIAFPLKGGNGCHKDTKAFFVS